ncbi:MAG TPA: cyclase family protein [Bacillota bacterium]|mgnify:CR=1 FL=1|jgi:kynurenine formamidase|nr:cyclase family protein [Bacillota bacterium]
MLASHEGVGIQVGKLLTSGQARVIDLSVLISEDTPAWCPGGQPFLRAKMNWFEGSLSRAPFFDYVLIMEEHTGTHCDAPAHMIPPEGSGLPHAGPMHNVTLEKIPVTQTMGPAAVIDCTDLVGTEEPGVSPVILPSRVLEWEEKHGKIRPGDVVLFYTGWTDLHFKEFPEGYKLDADCRFWTPLWGRERTDGFPAPNADTIRLLLDRGVRHVGVDTPSLGMIQDDNTPHWEALGNGMICTEKLCNLGKLPPRGAFYIFLPIKVKGGTGGPGRAIAII